MVIICESMVIKCEGMVYTHKDNYGVYLSRYVLTCEGVVTTWMVWYLHVKVWSLHMIII